MPEPLLRLRKVRMILKRIGRSGCSPHMRRHPRFCCNTGSSQRKPHHI